MKPRYYIFAIGILLVGFSTGWIMNEKEHGERPHVLKQVRENTLGYSLINPLLYVDTTESNDNEEVELRKKLDHYVDAVKTNNEAKEVSVYYRVLNTGIWTGVNEDLKYEPSSMLKVLVMISYYRLLRNAPDALNTLLPYENKIDAGQTFKPDTLLPTGKYTAEKLIERMIVHSDNEATDVLVKANQKGFDLVYNTLQLDPAPTDRVRDFLSPKSYSVIFRILFNSSYLARRLSDQALQLLTKTTFTKGLVAGVPSDITVAHKFGEQTLKTESGTVKERQLHDCGIVYIPENPYFICVMTKGYDFDKLEKIIADISKITYNFSAQK